MTNLDVIKYLSVNNPSRLADLLDEIYCIAWNNGSYASSNGEGKILEECEIDDFEEWIKQDAAESGFFLDREIEDWKSLIKTTSHEYCVKSPCPYEKPLTNYEHIKSMSVDEFTEWISKHSYSNWLKWFDKKYCKNCPDIMCKYEDGLTEFPCSYCEINDKCKFFSEKESVPNGKEIIKMWLESEVE